MRASTVPTLFFALFFAAGVTFGLPSLHPAPGTRDILDKHVADPVDLFLRGLGEPGLHEIQMQVRDYCSRFPCGEARRTSD